MVSTLTLLDSLPEAVFVPVRSRGRKREGQSINSAMFASGDGILRDIQH